MRGALVLVLVLVLVLGARPATAQELGDSIPFTREAIEAELNRNVKPELEKKRALPAPADPKDADALKREVDLLERDAKVLESALDVLARTAGLPGERKALDERAAAAERDAAASIEEAAKEEKLELAAVRPELVQEARLEQERLKKTLEAAEAALRTSEGAGDRIRDEVRALEDAQKTLDEGKRDYLARERDAKTPEERAFLRRRLAIREVNLKQHELRIAYLRESLELVKKDTPVRRVERDTLARRHERAQRRLSAYLKADEERLALERAQAEEEARRLEMLKRYGRPFEVVRQEIEAALARENLALQDELSKANRWQTRLQEMRGVVDPATHEAAAMLEKLDATRSLDERSLVAVTKIDAAVAHARAALLPEERRDAAAERERVKRAREEFEERAGRLAADLEARSAEAKKKFDQLHAELPIYYREQDWRAEERRWAEHREASLSLKTRRDAAIAATLDHLIVFEDFWTAADARVDELSTMVRRRTFWLRGAPIVDQEKLRPALDALGSAWKKAAAAARAEDGVEAVQAALARPGGIGRAVALALATGLVLLGLRRARNALEKRLRDEAKPPFTLRQKLARAGLRLARQAAPVAALVVAAAAAFGLFGGPRTALVLELSFVAAGLLLGWAVLRVVFRPHEPEWRWIPLPDDLAQLAERLLARLLALTMLHAAARILIAAGDLERPDGLRAAFALIYRDAVILLVLLATASPAVTGRVLGLISKGMAARLRRLLLPIGLFIGACIVAIFGLEAFGFHNASHAFTGSLVTSIAVIAGALAADRIVFTLLIARIIPHGLEEEQGETTAPAGEEDGSPAARRRFLYDLVGVLVSVAVAITAVAAIIAAFEVERSTIGGFLAFPLVGLGDVEGKLAVTVADVLSAALVLVATFAAHRYLRGFAAHYLLPRFGLTRGGRFAILAVAGYLILGIGVVLALRRIHVNLGELQWFLAAAGVGIGFGLQEILSNFVSGIILLIERPIQVGDIVTIDGVEGEVTQITIRGTTVETRDNIAIIVPNKNFITHSVVNWSHGDPKVRIKIPVGVAYGSNVHLVKKTLLEVAQSYGRVLKRPAPDVHFTGFGASSLDFALLVWLESPDPSLRAHVQTDLNSAIAAAFQRHRIEIPFPQMDLHVRSGDAALTVETREAPARPAAIPPAGAIPPPPGDKGSTSGVFPAVGGAGPGPGVEGKPPTPPTPHDTTRRVRPAPSIDRPGLPDGT